MGITKKKTDYIVTVWGLGIHEPFQKQLKWISKKEI